MSRKHKMGIVVGLAALVAMAAGGYQFYRFWTDEPAYTDVRLVLRNDGTVEFQNEGHLHNDAQITNKLRYYLKKYPDLCVNIALNPKAPPSQPQLEKLIQDISNAGINCIALVADTVKS